jgi:hypothetical protein
MKRKGRAAGNQRSNKRKRTREEEEAKEEKGEEREEEEVSSAGSSPLRELYVPDEMYLDDSVWDTIKKAQGVIDAKLGLFFKPSCFIHYRVHHLVLTTKE